jgi:hypothetical protein
VCQDGWWNVNETKCEELTVCVLGDVAVEVETPDSDRRCGFVVEANLTITLTGPLSPQVLEATVERMLEENDETAISIVSFWQTVIGSVALTVESGVVNPSWLNQLRESLAIVLNIGVDRVFVDMSSAAVGRRRAQSLEELIVFFNASAPGEYDLAKQMQTGGTFRDELVSVLNNITRASDEPQLSILMPSQVIVETLSTLTVLDVSIVREARSRSMADVNEAFSDIDALFQPAVLLDTINAVDRARAALRQPPEVRVQRIDNSAAWQHEEVADVPVGRRITPAAIALVCGAGLLLLGCFCCVYRYWCVSPELTKEDFDIDALEAPRQIPSQPTEAQMFARPILPPRGLQGDRRAARSRSSNEDSFSSITPPGANSGKDGVMPRPAGTFPRTVATYVSGKQFSAPLFSPPRPLGLTPTVTPPRSAAAAAAAMDPATKLRLANARQAMRQRSMAMGASAALAAGPRPARVPGGAAGERPRPQVWQQQHSPSATRSTVASLSPNALELRTTQELRTLAKDAGVDEEMIEEARDSDSPREALIELLQKSASPLARP